MEVSVLRIVHQDLCLDGTSGIRPVSWWVGHTTRYQSIRAGAHEVGGVYWIYQDSCADPGHTSTPEAMASTVLGYTMAGTTRLDQKETMRILSRSCPGFLIKTVFPLQCFGKVNVDGGDDGEEDDDDI